MSGECPKCGSTLTYADLYRCARCSSCGWTWIVEYNSSHPGETHRTAPTTAAGVVADATVPRLLGPGASSAEPLSPQAGVEPAREIVVKIPVEDPKDCPCSACEGARMSFGHYQTGA